MGWKQARRGLACILALVGCATGGIAHGQELHLNGPEYDVLLTINGLPFHGSPAGGILPEADGRRDRARYCTV